MQRQAGPPLYISDVAYQFYIEAIMHAVTHIPVLQRIANMYS